MSGILFLAVVATSRRLTRTDTGQSIEWPATIQRWEPGPFWRPALTSMLRLGEVRQNKQPKRRVPWMYSECYRNSAKVAEITLFPLYSLVPNRGHGFKIALTLDLRSRKHQWQMAFMLRFNPVANPTTIFLKIVCNLLIHYRIKFWRQPIKLTLPVVVLIFSCICGRDKSKCI